MSRCEVMSSDKIKTFQMFTPEYNNIKKARDKSIYRKNFSGMDNFDYVINKYSGDDYWCLNNYLRKNKVSGNYNRKELMSWAWCLHSSLQCLKSNVPNGTQVYRGISHRAPSDWTIGRIFYFGEFVSTTRDIKTAERFAKGKTLLIIDITNNGDNGHNNYCRDISEISQYDEQEVLITAFCRFKIKGKDNYKGLDRYYLDCLGY